jgi:hypothetical protein
MSSKDSSYEVIERETNFASDSDAIPESAKVSEKEVEIPLKRDTPEPVKPDEASWTNSVYSYLKNIINKPYTTLP